MGLQQMQWETEGLERISWMDSSGYREKAHFPTGKQCTNYADALIHNAHIVSTRDENLSLITFLTDDLFVLQALKNKRFDILSAVSTMFSYNGSLLTVAYQERKMHTDWQNWVQLMNRG